MSFGHDSTADEVAAGHDLRGRNVLVTGGTSGLGAETARVLASIGADVTITGRDAARGEVSAARLREESDGGRVTFDELALDSLDSVASFSQRFLANGKPLHGLINNAGIMAVPFSCTADGFEAHFGINHLGHFALATALLPALRAAERARVVALSSRAHRRSDVCFDDPNYRKRPYDRLEAYGQSKTAVALFALEFNNRYGSDGITANAVHPGAIKTGLQTHLGRDDLRALGWVDRDGALVPPASWKTLAQGAATTVWAMVTPDLEAIGGLYLDDCHVAQPWTGEGDPPNGYYCPYALDPDHAEDLWVLSSELTGGAD